MPLESGEESAIVLRFDVKLEKLVHVILKVGQERRIRSLNEIDESRDRVRVQLLHQGAEGSKKRNSRILRPFPRSAAPPGR